MEREVIFCLATKTNQVLQKASCDTVTDETNPYVLTTMMTVDYRTIVFGKNRIQFLPNYSCFPLSSSTLIVPSFRLFYILPRLKCLATAVS